MPERLWSLNDLARFLRYEDPEVRYWAAERLARHYTKEATDLYQSAKPDIVTLDLILGSEYGFSILMALRRMDPKVQVIVISAEAHYLSVEQAYNLGAVAYVGKPVNWDDLKAALDKVGAGQQ